MVTASQIRRKGLTIKMVRRMNNHPRAIRMVAWHDRHCRSVRTASRWTASLRPSLVANYRDGVLRAGRDRNRRPRITANGSARSCTTRTTTACRSCISVTGTRH